MVTRQAELLRILQELSNELPNPQWVALIDDDGLVVACVPDQPAVNTDRISAMTAASVVMADRALEEIEGGQLRYASLAGSKLQLLTVVLNKDRLLSIGLGPEVPPHATFGTLSEFVPDLLTALQKRFTMD
jgi:predicted regulator of Ras-like GTPase activity (Roadblock/LC7/MglB family)